MEKWPNLTMIEPRKLELLELSERLSNYYANGDEISELKYWIFGKKFDSLMMLLNEHKDRKVLLMRLKRNKKQTITLCLELLSICSDDEVIDLMKSISNKKHTWRIVQDKKLSYSWDFIESIFD